MEASARLPPPQPGCRLVTDADIGAFKTSLGDTTRAKTVTGARAPVVDQVVAQLSVHNSWRAQELGLPWRIT